MMRTVSFKSMISAFSVIFIITMVAGCSEAAVNPKEAGEVTEDGYYLVEDFSSNETKPPETSWEFISDQVMGGVSTGKIEFGKWDNRTCLHMTGEVSLENNGGFIQARKDLRTKGVYFNAKEFAGISLRVKGAGQTYAVHLRTQNSWLPWQFYQADFQTDGSWQQITIPFEKFVANSLKKPLDTAKIKSIAIVAIKKKFKADILVDRILFYTKQAMYNKLTKEEEQVIVHKGTERPFTGEYNDHNAKGVYTCKRCGAKLFESSSKFKSECGWPSFDDQIEGAVEQKPDADGVRTEILCANCGGHLGHIFLGERLTPQNARYCVNSISMNFTSADKLKNQRAIFASGCFWGTEYYLQRVPGVISTTVGYIGGHVDSPTYKQVCTGKTGHAEAVEVIFDPAKTDYEKIAKLFFETHDFTQLNRQGPDIGEQYRSEIFYMDEDQKKIALRLIDTLKQKGFNVKTAISPAGKFWPAEDYHQDYYNNNGKLPYCHVRKEIF
ncbi:MAG: bifunctional methionine sulfoxide reductase B/A protein [Sedimentisphaerales bacterium]|nr:bifunctional methionine sulfoxide reductase B/A protein [Sedimentisphaerales bacterium]